MSVGIANRSGAGDAVGRRLGNRSRVWNVWNRQSSALRCVIRSPTRRGSPGTFSAAQVCEILAVACEPPEQSGRPSTHWTRNELREEVITRGLVENISASQVGRYLRAAQLQPPRRKMWINTREKDPDVFRQEVEALRAGPAAGEKRRSRRAEEPGHAPRVSR